ncbi:hypothetical protein GOP47_0021790 [Adiantum capillus-veneris]|uniref:Mannosyl-oligosaccharide glucosidase n=1 Tax=Adiantum capillus-veneris TaxID=13818 RepID=A0A9D4U923_ADICA|nr:hypothetical protein GOP47_0021790 [Adiantum capillus-veneris]
MNTMASLQERRSARVATSSSQQTNPRKAHSKPSKEKRRERSSSRNWVLLFLVFISLIVVLFYSMRSRNGPLQLPTHITPFPGPKISDLSQFRGKHHEELYWGTYRSNLYLGIRARVPKSLLAGLMWISVDSSGMLAVRHTCEASDNMKRYGWLRHDGRSFGYQELLDGSMLLKTTFVKKKFSSSGYGGDWVVRIRVEDISEESSENIKTLLFYVADEAGRSLKLHPNDRQGTRLVSGTMKDAGQWTLHVKGMAKEGIHYVGYSTEHFHNITTLVSHVLQSQARRTGRLQLPDSMQSFSNLAIFQVDGKVPFEVEFVYVSDGGSDTSATEARVEQLSGLSLNNELGERETSFEKQFEQTFCLKEKGFDDRYVEAGMAALSNMLGGIGYFYGRSRIAVPSVSEGESSSQRFWHYWPSALYTAVPSRSMFPRGFLWDEGFHQLLIRRWDKKVSMEIIGNWLDLMNVDGWIPREQILGTESRSKVPEEFVLQHTSNANPPTLFLAIQDYLSTLSEESASKLGEEDRAFLERSFPRLQAWFNWFNTSQVGKLPGSYFWHGRNADTDRELNAKTLSSGLDDYPRSSHPSTDERHLDLRCWMVLATKSMLRISSLLGKDSGEYRRMAEQLANMDLLNKLHYDTVSGRYYDFGNHTEKVKLAWKVWQDPKTGYVRQELVRSVQRHPYLRLVPHFGYVSLFPFIMKLIPADSPVLRNQLDLIVDEKLLWTAYGLRSLATTSSMYMARNTEHDPPYWRGPVWININYLVLGALHRYSQEPGPYKDAASRIYTQLRDNLIRNVVESYNESGYLWEQYDNAANGRGKGAHPFTGWTSLILLVMAEQY